MEETTRDELHQDMRIMDDHERRVMRRKQKENEMIEQDVMIAELISKSINATKRLQLQKSPGYTDMRLMIKREATLIIQF